MNAELDIFSLFESMEWPANKQDILQYATESGFIDDVFDIINDIEVDDDYYFSSINDLISCIGAVFSNENDEVEGDNFGDETFIKENFDANDPLE